MGVFEDVLEKSSRKPSGPFHFLRPPDLADQAIKKSSHAGLTSTHWHLELHPVSNLPNLFNDIMDLSKRALDQNLFFEPATIGAFMPRMQNALRAKDIAMLCLFEQMGDHRELRIFMPVGVKKTGLPGRTSLHVLANEYLPDGTPLVDKDHADETCEILLKTLTDLTLGLPAIITFKFLRNNSRTANALRGAAGRLGLGAATSGLHNRASLGRTPIVIAKKRQKEYDRQLRKLSKMGSVSFGSTTALPQLVDAFEDHLVLELKGWKGNHGTALYNNKSSTGFARAMIVELAQRKACEIFSLTLDEKPIATMVLLGENPRLLTWKTAYKESLAAMSPGVLLALHVTQQLQSREGFELADSLAIANHPMIDHLWHERITIADLAIALNKSANKSLPKLMAANEREEKWNHRARNIRKVFRQRF